MFWFFVWLVPGASALFARFRHNVWWWAWLVWLGSFFVSFIVLAIGPLPWWFAFDLAIIISVLGYFLPDISHWLGAHPRYIGGWLVVAFVGVGTVFYVLTHLNLVLHWTWATGLAILPLVIILYVLRGWIKLLIHVLWSGRDGRK